MCSAVWKGEEERAGIDGNMGGCNGALGKGDGRNGTRSVGSEIVMDLADMV